MLIINILKCKLYSFLSSYYCAYSLQDFRLNSFYFISNNAQ
jgi:hypothetical protein